MVWSKIRSFQRQNRRTRPSALCKLSLLDIIPARQAKRDVPSIISYFGFLWLLYIKSMYQMYTERAKSVFVNRRGFKRLLQSPFPVGQADKILRRLLHGEHMRLEVSMETSHPAAAVTKSRLPFIVHPVSRKWMLTWLHQKPKRKSKRHHFPLNPGHIQVADPGHIIYFNSLLIPCPWVLTHSGHPSAVPYVPPSDLTLTAPTCAQRFPILKANFAQQ